MNLQQAINALNEGKKIRFLNKNIIDETYAWDHSSQEIYLYCGTQKQSYQTLMEFITSFDDDAEFDVVREYTFFEMIELLENPVYEYATFSRTDVNNTVSLNSISQTLFTINDIKSNWVIV